MAPLQQQHNDNVSVASTSSISESSAVTQPWFPLLLNENGEQSNFMDCVINGLEHSIDILSCEQLAVPKPHPTIPPVKLEPLDYAKSHDEFLEALFQEQLRNNQAQSSSTMSSSERSSVFPSERRAAGATSTDSDIVIPALSDSSATDEDDSMYQNLTTSEQQQEQLRRPLKLSRRSPLRQSRKQISNRQVAPMMLNQEQQQQEEPKRQQQQPYEAEDDDVTIQSVVSCITVSQLKDPPTYLADSVKLQKDKGKGETPGSDICATGKAACLEKLRQKVELLTQVAVGNEGGKKAKSKSKKSKSASMKRCKAKVAEQTPVYTETRSVIDLKMGFLAIQYGVLCRWDRSGKIVLVVLRKMCHESFYKKEMRLTKSKTDVPQAVVLRDEPPIVQENNVILQRLDGTEVTLLEPPYRVSRPVQFVPSLLSVSVHRLEGFKLKSMMLKLTLDGVSHKIKCDLRDGIMTPILDDPCDWLLDQTMELDFVVQLYELRKPRRKRLLTTERLLVNLLDGSRISATRTIFLPLRQGALVFNMALKSDYCQWLYQELEARRKEEVVRHVVQPSAVYTPYIEEPVVENGMSVWIDLCCT